MLIKKKSYEKIYNKLVNLKTKTEIQYLKVN